MSHLARAGLELVACALLAAFYVAFDGPKALGVVLSVLVVASAIAFLDSLVKLLVGERLAKEPERGEFAVVLEDVGDRAIQILKLVREHDDETRTLDALHRRGVPHTVVTGVSETYAEKYAQRFIAHKAVARVVDQSDPRLGHVR